MSSVSKFFTSNFLFLLFIATLTACSSGSDNPFGTPAETTNVDEIRMGSGTGAGFTADVIALSSSTIF